MRKNVRWTRPLAAVLLVAAAACVDRTAAGPTAAEAEPEAAPLAALTPGSLAWFGYADEDRVDAAASLTGTESYANWGQVITDSFPSSTHATTRIDALALRGQMALVELGPVFWNQTVVPHRLHTNWQARFNTWRTANSRVLTQSRVIAFLIGDAPHHNGMSVAQWDSAAALVKQTFPWAKVVLIDGAASVADANPASGWNQAPTIQNVDWVGLSIYGIRPDTSSVYQTARQKMKARYPGKRWVYVGDGYFGDPHRASGFTLDSMGVVMKRWYDVAAADPDAILMGVFIWPSFGEGVGSKDFSPAVLAVHTQVGRAITRRARRNDYLPVGVLDSVSAGGWASGWACDPDAAWGETVLVDLYVDGSLRSTVRADQANQPYGVIPQCRSGLFRRFRTTLMAGPGQRVTAVARDLDAGSTQLPWAQISWVRPSYDSWGPANTLTVAGLAGSGTGGVQMTWRDRTANGPWTPVGYAPVPLADGSWSNTIPSRNYCHDYDVYVRYAGFRTSTFTYSRASKYCTNRMLWIQPQPLAGFGPAGSLVVSGSLVGAPAGSGVTMYWRNVTLNGPWTQVAYAAQTDANGVWYNHIPNANYGHRYAVYSRYDGGVQSVTCTYLGTNAYTACS